MRFEVRHLPANDYRIWDDAADRWADDNLYQRRVDVDRAAAELEVRFDHFGPRDPAAVVRVTPPRRVEVRVIAQRWRSATLDMWLREPDGWYGHVKMADQWYWKPADRLRPFDD